jgi:type II secretory ATPase GspE/PulE/Tfp pilus assembly ATPase PilB-like protein
MQETDIVKELLTTAKEYKASDIHIDPTNTCVRIRLRVAGVEHAGQ